MLTGTSAFAETRHRDETRDPSSQRWDRSQSQRNDNRNADRNRASASETNRSFDTTRRSNDFRSNSNRGTDNRSYDNRSRSYDNRSYRGDNRGYRGESRSFEGRVQRVERYNGGFRVWVGGAPYPFFIGADRWSRFPIRVGLSIRLGGYWNPGGYYDVYDVGPYATAGQLHGIVESVDYRRGTIAMRDDVSGSFVTVVMRGNDPRFGGLRPGDYVDLSGAWNRAGVFDAYNVYDIRNGAGGYSQYDDRPYGY
jgi:hypothetical protein